MVMWKVSNLEAADAVFSALARDPAATAAYQALVAAGGTVYAVGGAVRDGLLGKQPKDVDLMVAGLNPEAIHLALAQLPGRTDLTGKAFGVFRYRDPSGMDVEVAMPRTEHSTGVGHQDFEVSVDPNMTPEDDLFRRDFTANAMAINLEDGSLLDPYHGAEDIAAGRLRLVNPQALKDDPLRTVRALVAQARHGLMPDEELMAALAEDGNRIAHLPGERIQAELDKLLLAPDPVTAIEIARETGLLGYLLPEVDATFGFDQKNPYHDLDVGSHLLEVFRYASTVSNDPDVRMAALLHDIGKPDSFWEDEDGHGHFYKTKEGLGDDHDKLGAEYAEQLLRRLRYPNDRRERIVNLIRHHMFPVFTTPAGARKFLRRVGDVKVANDLITLREADINGKRDKTDSQNSDVDQMRALLSQVVGEGNAFTLKDLAINGSDLLGMGMEPGPNVGKVLHKLLDYVVDRPELNTPEVLTPIAYNLVQEMQ